VSEGGQDRRGEIGGWVKAVLDVQRCSVADRGGDRQAMMTVTGLVGGSTVTIGLSSLGLSH
jgi:hypothetical protein